jgi:hypothetical protein
MAKGITPERIASILYSALGQRDFNLEDIKVCPVIRRESRRGFHVRSHRVKEWFFEVRDGGTSKPVLVCVRIADTRPERVHEIPEEPGKDFYRFDASGLPIR